MRAFRLHSRPAWIVLTTVAATLAALVSARVVEHRLLDGMTVAARADARLRAALLDSEIARYRLLPLALADDRDIVSGLAGNPRERHAIDLKLEAMARATGAPVLYVIAPRGRAIAASNWRDPASFVGRDYRFRRYFAGARTAGQADQFARGTVSGRPGLYLARRTVNGGVMVVKLEFTRIEAAWRAAGGITTVRDRDGVTLVTSQPAWRYGTSQPLAQGALRRISTAASITPGALRPLPIRPAPDGRGVLVGGVRFVIATAATTQPGWTLTLLRPAGPALRVATRAAVVGAVAGVVVLAALLWLMLERRARVRRRTADLEQAVEARTLDLRREMEERAATEARAAELRESLRQANRLASLGQITAGVAHETAQPVAAIRTYSQTSETLLDRGDTDAVRENLATIRRLADRIGRVTAELRGFARRSTGAVRPVPLAEVIDGAVLILREQLAAATLSLPPVPATLHVLGGRVRLEQVVVILLQNAIEALRDRPRPAIRLTLHVETEVVRLVIADNGPGIPPEIAGRLFTPFVTSRPNGLGLGLVIAQDIMTDLDGTLRLLETTAEGAAFEMRMRRA